MKKTLFVILFSFLFSWLVPGQSVFPVRSNVEQLPQVFTPTAAGLGRYGKVPVSYFNGLPNITVPIIELRAKNYTLPVFLSYHAGGNKPSEHAGPVGLGWSLNAGGCINRIVNGLKDEMDGEELEFLRATHDYQQRPPLPSGGNPQPFIIVEPVIPDPGNGSYNLLGPGLFYNWSRYDDWDWSDESVLDAVARNDYPQDYEPDEFVVNMDGLSASFYFNGSGGIDIVSSTAESFTVDYTLASCDSLRLYSKGASHLDVHYFTYISELVLTKGDGTRYTFGGTPTSIDFHYTQDRLLGRQRLIATADTWYLTEIAVPGGETIVFTYNKSGFPVVKQDVHTKLYVHYREVFTASPGGATGNQSVDHVEEVYTDASDYSNLSLTILNPSYLTRIESTVSGDYLNFTYNKTDELESDVSHDEFVGVMGAMTGLNVNTFLEEENYHNGLLIIDGPTAGVLFDYRGLINQNGFVQPMTSVSPPSTAPKERLRLDRLLIFDKTDEEGGKLYRFTYNGVTLPHSYTSKMTDHWGYYSAYSYHDVLSSVTSASDVFYQNTLNAMMDLRRVPSENRMKAEILERIVHPTGLVTKFEYEPHYYHKIASCYNPSTHQYDFSLRNISGMAGGLRIRSITDSLADGRMSKRRFEYNDSGILSGKPLYGAIGRSRLSTSYTDPGLFGESFDMDISFTDVHYRIASEHYINQLSTTSGNHVTYGAVTEVFPDSSRVTYYYSDHTTVPDTAPIWTEANINCSLLQDPITSMQLGRGLLLGVDYRNSSGMLVRRDTMVYSQPGTNDYILAISKQNPAPSGSLKRVAVNRIATYHPGLLTKTTTTWGEDGGVPIIETERYAYNGFRRMSSRVQSRGNESDSLYVVRAEDIQSPTYRAMKGDGYGSFVVEQVDCRNGNVVSASLTTWKNIPWAQGWAEDKLYHAELSSAIPSALWTPYDGISVPSHYGNAALSFAAYDSHLNVTDALIRGGRHRYFQWDDRGMNIIAQSDAGPFLFLDFETASSSVEGGYKSEKCMLGPQFMSFQTPAAVPYLVDYRIRRDEKWEYECHPYTGNNMVIGTFGALIDDVRIYPAGHSLVTYGYYPNNMLRYATDVRGITSSYSYDGFLRLRDILDNTDNPVQSYKCHYRYNDRSGALFGDDPYVGKNAFVKKTYMDSCGIAPYVEETFFNYWGLMEKTVKKGASVRGSDIVQTYTYDNKGRLWKEYMPHSSTDSAPIVLDTDYTETVYDESPLDRVKVMYGPGNVWRNGGHAARYSYITNSSATGSSLRCKRYSVSYDSSGGAVVSIGQAWPSGMLDVSMVMSEDSVIVFTFNDYLGREVLSRIMTDESPGQEHWQDTYYCYDDMGRLAAVFPPSLCSALDTLSIGAHSEADIQSLSDFAYLYRYDSRGRCIAKRLPGCEWIYYVYDESDRLIFEQDGNDRAVSRWKFVICDSQGRECLRGTCSNVFNPFSNPLVGITVETSRDYPLTMTRLQGYYIHGINLTAPKINRVQWWDDYSFLDIMGIPSSFSIAPGYVLPDPEEPYGVRYQESSSGLLTGMSNLVLGSSTSDTNLWKVFYYDDKGNIVRRTESKPDGILMTGRFGYDFAGNITALENKYTINSTNSITEKYIYTYDTCGRPLKTTHVFGNGEPVVLSDIVYDSVGRIGRDKRNGSSALNTYYSYNIRSWLTSISTGPDGATFKEKLQYQPEYVLPMQPQFPGGFIALDPDPGESPVPRWGGDISSQTWTTGTGANRIFHKYNFMYDKLSRITEAQFASTDTTRKFSRRYSYDAEGNLLTAYKEQDVGFIITGYKTTDTLIYQGNHLRRRLRHVEGGLTPLDIVSAFPGAGGIIWEDSLSVVVNPQPMGGSTEDEYSYDLSGNLTMALPDDISSITYNLINLPETVQLTGTKGRVDYRYSADGEKLSRTYIKNGAIQEQTSYVGPLVFEGGTPKLLLVDGGYVMLTRIGSNYLGTYYFHIKDHQGNIRLVTSDAGSVVQTNYYDPYGETSYGPLTSNINHYSGKEWDSRLRAYDFGARMYMPSYSRFTTMDPLCEQDPGRSPYLYCAGNPVNLVDPDGMVPRIYIQKHGFPGHAFITTGEGRSTTVYTYGRYGALYPVSSGITMGQVNPTGEGVLGILRDYSAESYLQNTLKEGSFEIYELQNGDECRIDSFFESKFSSGSSPTNEAKSTYDNPNYRVIDKYNVFNNNCVTTTREAAIEGGVDIHSESISPKRFDKDLSNQSATGQEIQVIFNPEAFLEELLYQFYE